MDLTAYVTNAAGNWSTTTIWTPNGTPGDGDTVTISHAVTMDQNTTIGTSPAEDSGTWAIIVDSGVTLTIAANVTLTLRGDAKHSNGRTIFSAGATLEFDSSQATDPTNQNYHWDLTDTINQSEANMEFNGTSGNHCTVQSNASGGTGYIDEGTIDAGLEAYFTDFTDINNPANNRGVSTYPNGSDMPNIFEDCTFDDGCGRIGPVNLLPNNVDCHYYRVNHQGDTGSGSCIMTASGTLSTGTREIKDCYFKGSVNLNCRNATIHAETYGNVFENGYSTAASTDFDVFEDTLVYNATGGFTLYNDCDRIYWIMGQPSNPHLINLQDANNTSFSIRDCVMELNETQTGDTGDLILATNGPDTLIVTGNVITLDNAGKAWGTLCSCLGNAGQGFEFRHNTAPAGIVVGETYNSHAGQIADYRSNLIWDVEEDNTAVHITNINGSPITDVLSADDADFNCIWQGSASPYDTPMSGTPGTNDVDVDPMFINGGAKLEDWDAHLGGAGTFANAMTELGKLHLSGWNSSYNAKAALAWVRDQHKVQNTSLRDAGHDGATIGAMPFQAPIQTVPINTQQNRRTRGQWF